MTTESPAILPSDRASPRPRPNLRRLLPLVVLALLGVAYATFRYVQARRPYEWSGTVEARDISVGSRAGGRVKQVLVREGEHVELGRPLITLEPGELQAERLIAAGQLAQVEANLDKLLNGARPEEVAQARARAATAAAALEQSRRGPRAEDIAQARARLVSVQAALDKAQADADRTRRLFASGAISRAEADNAEAALKSATGQRDAQQHALEELVNGVRREEVRQAEGRAMEARAQEKLVVSGSRVEDIKAAQGMVDAAKGRLEQIDVMIRELVIVAPVAARVESLDLRPGDILAPNATAATLLEVDQLYVRIYVPETQIGRIHVGDVVPVHVDSFPHRSFAGAVEHISSVGEFSPRNLQTADERADQVFAMRVGLRDGADVLRAGMAAFIEVPR
jgi:multidrug resistance efflux pump